MSQRTVELHYGATLDDATEGKRLIDNVSAAAYGGGHLWTAADEGLTFQRLTRRDQTFAAARSFDLGNYFAGYPPGVENEADLEGLALDQNRLWMTGSHSLTRKKPEKRTVEKLLGEHSLNRELARTLLGFIEIGVDGIPVANSGRALPLGDQPGSLLAEMARDWHELAQATRRPAKENGLDVEGIATRGTQVFIGLRGPVVGPYAIVIEIEVEVTGASLGIVRNKGPACRPHLIDTGGLGVRDLAMQADGLLLLAGPALDMEGPFHLYLSKSPLMSWQDAPGPHRNAKHLYEIAIERTADKSGRSQGRRPEALAVLDDGLLVIAERDHRAGVASPGVLVADLLPLPSKLNS